MSLRIRPATPDDREPVVSFLKERMNPKIPSERWRRLFDYPWRPADAPDCGRILEANGSLAGFLGATYVDRQIGGRTERICNMSSWYLLPEQRGRGIGRDMALDLTRDERVSATDLTATLQVQRLLLAHCGFRILDDERWILRKRARGADDVALLSGATLEAHLGPADRALLARNAGPDVRAIGVEAAEGLCLLVIQVKKQGADIAYHQLLHASTPTLLARHAQAVADALLPREQAVLAIDRRFSRDPPAGAEAEPVPQPRLYKSSRLAAAEIDNLYNEVLLLDQKLP